MGLFLYFQLQCDSLPCKFLKFNLFYLQAYLIRWLTADAGDWRRTHQISPNAYLIILKIKVWKIAFE